MKLYVDIATYYRERPERMKARELDFGQWWREPGTRGPWYHVTWNEAFGELLIHSPAAGFYELDHAVEVVALVPNESDVRALLDGWEKCVEEGSLAWVRERVAAAVTEGRYV
jgi:hypothetical protein